jgi:RimJ/RimL family protein N-acetyltransferase
MRAYKCLKNQVFSFELFQIIPIRDNDKWDILKMRNEQMFHLRQNKILSEVDQENYFKNVVDTLFDLEFPEQILFSFLEDNQFVGYGGLVHIDWNLKTAEISFIMQTDLQKSSFSKFWTIYLKLIEEVAFLNLKLDKIYTYAYDLRPNLYPVLENAGFELKAKLENEIEFDGEFIDVIIHEKQNSKLFFRKAIESDVKLVFNWANDEMVRQNSFNSNLIDFEKHCDWYKRCLSNSLIDIYMFFDDNYTLLGIVRFQKINKKNSVISISIDKTQRGKGIAKKMLIKASQFYLSFNLYYTIIAYIKPQNLASISIFKNAGYKEVISDMENGLKFEL